MPEPTEPDPAPSPSTPADPAPNAPATPDTDAAAALKAEVDKWKHLAQEHEKRAKGNSAAAKELEELRKSQMTEQEKAVAEAKASARSEALAELSAKLVGAEIRAALTGIVPDPAAIIEDLNLSRYVTESGDVDAKQVEALKAKYAALANAKPQTPKVPSGPRSDGKSGEVYTSREQLKNLAPEMVMAAHREGRIQIAG